MRPIDADALIKDICNSCDGACDKVDCDCLACKRSCRCDVITEISEAPTIDPAALAPRWVSVEERLPPNDKQVLCWYEYFRYGDYNRMYQCYGIGICINGNWCGEVANGTNCRVIAWQPLSEPPKEGEKDA